MKFNSMINLNFEKHDEFIEYEQYLNNSYFSHLVSYVQEISTLHQNLSKDEWISAYVDSTASKAFEEIKTPDWTFTFTQDLQVYSNKFERIPKQEELKEKWLTHSQFTDCKERGDVVFSYLKFDWWSNYKPNFVNSLWVFESEKFFHTFKNFNLLSMLLAKKDLDLHVVDVCK